VVGGVGVWIEEAGNGTWEPRRGYFLFYFVHCVVPVVLTWTIRGLINWSGPLHLCFISEACSKCFKLTSYRVHWHAQAACLLYIWVIRLKSVPVSFPQNIQYKFYLNAEL